MPTMIAVMITQEDNDIPTMVLPFLDTLLDPHTLLDPQEIPAKKMTQKTLNFGNLVAPPTLNPTHELRAVNGHFRENTYVTTHMRKMKIKKQGTKKEAKTNNSKKGMKAKHGVFAKLDDDCEDKENVHYARSVYMQQLRDLVKGNKN
jgi:hypothetical protein